MGGNRTGNSVGAFFRVNARLCILLAGMLLQAAGAFAQATVNSATTQPKATHPSTQAAASGALPASDTIPVLLLSDIHFEPYWDPGKVPQLAAAPVSEWKAILAAPPSVDRTARFASLQQSCPARGEDTSNALFESSLRAMRTHAAGAKFATVSGDLISHGFNCKYTVLFPHPSLIAYREFVEKTLDYVIEELGSALPGVPVYVALGNNDSDCGDYRLSDHTEFLSVIGGEVTKGFPSADRQSAMETFAAGGYYSVAMPAPVRNTRLLVLNDIFMSKNYKPCPAKADPAAADAQLAWLEQQLADARRNKETIWVMGHIPPGVDLHGTVTKMRDVCHGQSPEMFLSSEKMADELVEFSDVVRLAIFAHTHMDEMHVLTAESAGQHPDSGSGVVVKGVSSISPINGNAPSFTVARIQPSSAEMMDYRVFSASNQTGVDTVWKEEYDFAKTYHEEAFSPAAVSKLIAGFKADPDAKTKASQDYIRDFFVGSDSPLGLVWPQYACSMANDSAQGFSSCVCAASK